MPTPLTDQQSAAIEAGRTALRARFAGGAFPAALGQAIADDLADEAMGPALAEVARLRAENTGLRDLHDVAIAACTKAAAQRDTARTELAQARSKIRAVEHVRCWTNEDGKRFVFADDLLTAVQLAAPARTCRAEAVHQAGCPAAEEQL